MEIVEAVPHSEHEPGDQEPERVLAQPQLQMLPLEDDESAQAREPDLDATPAREAEAGQAIPDTPPAVEAPPRTRVGLIYLGICAIFAAFLAVPMLIPGPTPPVPKPCGEGAEIAQALAVPDPSGATHLYAVVRPPAFPNLALGNEPGCEALYRSDDNGITWTTVFSTVAEAPQAVVSAGSGNLFMLTQRLHFPYYLAGNIYHSQNPNTSDDWKRVSPQSRHDVPMVAITNMLVGEDGSLVILAQNGDGGALLRSPDGGVTWQPVVIPDLVAVASVAMLGPLIAVAPPSYTAGQSPGLVSADGGLTWRPLGVLPNAPNGSGLRALLAGDPVERALILRLAPLGAVLPDHAVARYASFDGGGTWTTVSCEALPAPGCAPPERWTQAGDTRYVLYHRRIWAATGTRAWHMLPQPLPVRSDAVLQLLAVPGIRSTDLLYLVTATGIWRLEGGRWLSSSGGLALGAATSVES